MRNIVQVQMTQSAALNVSRKRKKKISPLTHILTSMPKADLENLETTTPFITAPWDTAPMSNISSNDLEALINHERLLAQNSSLVYYTDGMGLGSKTKLEQPQSTL